MEPLFWWLKECVVLIQTPPQKHHHANTTTKSPTQQHHHKHQHKTTNTKTLQYHSILQSTTSVLLQYYKVLLRTTKYYSSTTKYYSSTTKSTPVLLRTTKYYSSTTPYYKVQLQYANTTKYNTTTGFFLSNRTSLRPCSCQVAVRNDIRHGVRNYTRLCSWRSLQWHTTIKHHDTCIGHGRKTQSINHQDFSVATTNRIRSASSLSAMFCHSLDKLGWSYSTVKCTANFVHIEVSNTKWSYRMDGSYRQTSHSPFCERSEEQLLKECRQLWHPLLRNAWARTATPQVPNSEWQPGPQRHRSLTVNDNLSYVCSLRLCHRYIRSHDCLYMYSIILSWIHMTYRTYMFELKQVYDQQAFFIRGVMSHAIVMATCTLLFIEPNDNKTTSLFQCCLQVRFYDNIIMFHGAIIVTSAPLKH